MPDCDDEDRCKGNDSNECTIGPQEGCKCTPGCKEGIDAVCD